MFNLDKVHIILDEMILNGHVVETNKSRILAPLLVLDKMVESWERENLSSGVTIPPFHACSDRSGPVHMDVGPRGLACSQARCLHRLNKAVFRDDISHLNFKKVCTVCMCNMPEQLLRTSEDGNTTMTTLYIYFANIFNDFFFVFLEHTHLKIFVYFKLQLELNKCL